MLNTKFSPWPAFTQEEADAVQEVLLSNKVNYWTGNECRTFEKEFAKFADCDHAVAVANGTVALDLALKALDIGIDDEVIVTPRTFIASISTVMTAGATPVFADVDVNSQNIEAHTIAPCITPKTKAIIVVHLAGMPAEMDAIMTLAKKHQLYVIEDCAQAHGAKYKGQSVGSIGHIGTWSFCQDKIMTTGGEGGMVTTNDEILWKKMWSYKDHGKNWDTVYNTEHPSGFRWLHDNFGTNWRMLEMQAVIGLIQLQRMPDWFASRTKNISTIWQAAKRHKGLHVPDVPDHITHAAYKCYVFVEAEKLKTDWSRDRIMNSIIDAGVPCYSGSCSEVYLEKAFDNHPSKPKQRLTIAKELSETSLMFLVHPTLREEEIAKTCHVLQIVMQQAARD